MRPNATTLLAFVLGAAIAGGGTASAAKLITGADIKNGSITVKDLSPGCERSWAKPGQPEPRATRARRGTPARRATRVSPG